MPDTTTAQGDQHHIPFEAGWPNDLQHRPDPNRVRHFVPAAGSRGEGVPASAHAPKVESTALTRPPSSYTQDAQLEPSYYDISPLKSPLWGWEIAWYFYLGGISSAAYAISRMADRAGGAAFREVSRAASFLSFATLLPCPPLLIHDLGDRKRFHHMLRVFKPTSPMSLGTWAIMGYSGVCTGEVFRHLLVDYVPAFTRKPALRTVNNAMRLTHDVAGVPLALTVAGYTGVLLSSTANPLWVRNKWLGPLFSASAVATGAAATSLALAATAKRGGKASAHNVLHKVDTAAHIVEAICLFAFLREAGPKAKTLRTGTMRRHHQITIGGLILGELIKLLPLHGRAKRLAGYLSSIMSLVSGFSLRWAMVHGGQEAAKDPHTARLASRGTKPVR